VTFTVWDLTLEQYRVAHSFVEITTTAAGVGTPGTKSLQLYRGRNLGEMALLIRGDVSPYGEGMSMQYEIPYCFMSGNPKPVLRKGEPAGIELTFTLMRNPSAVTAEQSFGRLVQQYQQPLP
jgi:hypothetical protein